MHSPRSFRIKTMGVLDLPLCPFLRSETTRVGMHFRCLIDPKDLIYTVPFLFGPLSGMEKGADPCINLHRYTLSSERKLDYKWIYTEK